MSEPMLAACARNLQVVRAGLDLVEQGYVADLATA
jgi:hypothetical protein